MTNLYYGGALRATSRLASAPMQSGTQVHSCIVLGAKHDLASHCIRRGQQRFRLLTNHWDIAKI